MLQSQSYDYSIMYCIIHLHWWMHYICKIQIMKWTYISLHGNPQGLSWTLFLQATEMIWGTVNPRLCPGATGGCLPTYHTRNSGYRGAIDSRAMSWKRMKNIWIFTLCVLVQWCSVHFLFYPILFRLWLQVQMRRSNGVESGWMATCWPFEKKTKPKCELCRTVIQTSWV